MPRTVAIPVSLLLLLAFVAVPSIAERGDDANRASKNGELEATTNGGAVHLEYGRPNVKGREIWGALVPYDQVWRTGADEATTITFEQDVKIEGKPLAAGTYSLFTIPSKDSWTIIFNSVANQWGAFNYDESKDVLRVEVQPWKTDDAIEEMDFVVENSRVVLRWEHVAVPFEVAAGGS